MSYRPITDLWILGRSKTKYHGAYLSGFLERARPLLVGGSPDAIIAHIPGGMAKEYNGKKGGITLSGFGANDWTMDIRPECKPNVLFDVRYLDQVIPGNVTHGLRFPGKFGGYSGMPVPDAILIDRPYTLEDHSKYHLPPEQFPNLNKLLKDCLRLVKPGGHVGVIDFEWPQPGKGYKEIAAIGVSTGRSSRMRVFTVWRKM
jgi:hypothetical protein